MKVQVTQEHIDFGQRHSHTNCPIGHAFHDMDDTHEWSIGMNRISWTTNKGSFEAHTPPEAEQFIKDFDNKQGVKPFEFDLEPRRAVQV